MILINSFVEKAVIPHEMVLTFNEQIDLHRYIVLITIMNRNKWIDEILAGII